MKKLTAILLAVMMTMCLTVPAFAAPAEAGPGYFVGGEPAPVYTPGEAVPISMFLPEAASDKAFGIIGGADGPTSIITSGPLNLGSINWDGLDLEGLDPDTAGWAELEKQLQERQQQLIDQQKAALGGVPGQIGVMVNGRYIQFPDAAPEVADGRTMVPVRALVETLGGEVDYRDGAVQFVIDGYAYEFAIGSTTVKVSPTADNDKDTPKPEDIKMDCAPYIKDGRTYVPVRFIAQALGYQVGWDGQYETAILLDREAMAADIDKNFAILNKVQASHALALKDGESGKADIKGKLDLTIASLEGNKTYSSSFDVTGLVNAEAVSGSVSLNVSDALVELLMAETGMSEKDGQEVEVILGALKKFEFIMNKDGKAWVHSDGLDSMAGQKNLWLSGSADMDLSALYAAGADASSVGKVAAAMAGTDSVANWAMVNQIVKLMGIYSDDKFTTTGGTSTLTIGFDDLMGLYKDMGLSEADVKEAKDAFKEYEITMKVDSKGGATVKCAVETNAVSGVPGMKMTIDADQSGGKGAVTMDINVAGMGRLKLTLDAAQRTTNEKPMTEPPAGANVMDAPELLK